MTYPQLHLAQLLSDPSKKSELLEKTKFLDHIPKVPTRQRLWHIDNNVFHIPVCETCKTTLLKWHEAGKKYRMFCSSKCSLADPRTQQNRENTCIEKYGETTNLKAKSNKEKAKATLMERYGVDNAFKSEIFKEKSKKTSLEKYGTEFASSTTEVKAKINETNIERYSRKRKSQQHISIDVIELKNNRELMENWHHVKKMPIALIAETLGINHSQLCTHFRDNLKIDIIRHNISFGELQLREELEKIAPGVWEYGNRTILKPKEIDAVSHKNKLAIEFHGLAWHSELRGKSKSYHLDKMNGCNDNGYNLIQITDLEWNENKELVLSRIKSKLEKTSRVFARKCTVKEITPKEADKFLNDTHIQASCVSSHRLGLFHDSVLVAVMTFGKPRFNKKFQWELLRYSSSKNVTVVGGAGKLFAHFLKTVTPSSMVSYCDLRWNSGKLYERLGFTKTRTTGPNYWYTHRYATLENRMKYQKHKLKKLFPDHFDERYTEWEIMQHAGYDRFWDCGNIVFEWTVDNKSTV